MGVKLNPFTGKLQLISKEASNFSYKYIETGEAITIPENQEMVIHEEMTVDGDLEVDGDIVSPVQPSKESGSYATPPDQDI